MYADTINWRTKWWANLIEVTHADPVSVIFGMGYGYPIWLHNQFDKDFNPTPHNIFIYVLVYTGWLGVLLFYLLQISIGAALAGVSLVRPGVRHLLLGFDAGLGPF